jgi:hypothetical protein
LSSSRARRKRASKPPSFSFILIQGSDSAAPINKNPNRKSFSMRPMFLLATAAAFLLCCPVFASDAYDNAAESLIFRLLLPNETFSYSIFSEDGSISYYLVSIDGQERLIVRASPAPDGMPGAVVAVPVVENSTAAGVLRKILEKNGSNESALGNLASVHLLLKNFSSSRQPGEHKCDILIGMDEHNCTDFLSCQKACYSRTSFCQPLAIGIGRPLINAMFDYSNGTKNLTVLLAEEDSLYAALSSQKTPQNLDAYLDTLTAINLQATRINDNPLFYDYQMCFPPGYNMASLTRAKLEMLSIHSKAMPILQSGEQGRLMAEFAKARFAALPKETAPAPKSTSAASNASNGAENATASPAASTNNSSANAAIIPKRGGQPSDADSSAQGAESGEQASSAAAQIPLILLAAAAIIVLIALAAFRFLPKKQKK